MIEVKSSGIMKPTTPEEQAVWDENVRLLEEMAAYAKTVRPYTPEEQEQLDRAMDSAEHGA